MPKLTDTQTIVLSRAASRPGNLAMPLPEGLHGAAAQKAVTAMITRGRTPANHTPRVAGLKACCRRLMTCSMRVASLV